MIEKIMNISGNSYEWNETMKDLTGRTGVHHGVLSSGSSKGIS